MNDQKSQYEMGHFDGVESVKPELNQLKEQVETLRNDRVELGIQIEAFKAEITRLKAAPVLLDVIEPLSFERFAATNKARCDRWQPLGNWSVSDWGVALTGEIGEVSDALELLSVLMLGTTLMGRAGKIGDAIKKYNRYRDAVPGAPVTREAAVDDIGKELADVLIYCDLLAQRLGISLAEVLTRKFNEKSDKLGFPERL
jgi:NTP pyrophosphatase (non-canonical NTP hydrolase)